MSRRERNRRRRRRRSHPVTRVFGVGLLVLVCGLVLAGAAVAGWIVSVADSAPDINQLKPRIPGQVSEVFASDGSPLGYIASDVLRTVVPQSQQPALLREATVAIEDRRFYQHGGVDYQGILRAGIKDLLTGHTAQGGSTLTMQLVDNVYLPNSIRNHHDVRYKIIQAKLANELESRHSKPWVLTQYLNDVPYGTTYSRTAIGVGAASQMFFDKPVQRLDLAQYALLAGLPQAPTDYNPFLHPTLARNRRNEVLGAMVQSGYISRAEADAAKASPLQVKHNDIYGRKTLPYVFDYVQRQLVSDLGQAAVDRGGLKVYTTIDPARQREAQAALNSHEGGSGQPAAALVSIDPTNGDIQAMANTSAYGTGPGETTFDYATQSRRQTGSAFKVFALMTLIHDYDGDPNQTYYDSHFLAPGWLPAYPTYKVSTAEDTYQGEINITKATWLSDNTVFAQLAQDLGMDKVSAIAHQMGITSPLSNYPSEVLGAVAVSPLQMADAYATIASGGIHHPPTAIAKVMLPNGKPLDLGDPTGTRVFSAAEAYEADTVLKDVLTIPGATGTAAYYGCPAAGKTGTTTSFTDAYFDGFTPQLATAVWVGYPNETQSMPGGYGGTLAAPIWHDYMQQASNGYCSDFTPPAVPWQGTPYFGKHSGTAKSNYGYGSGTPYPGAGPGGAGPTTTSTTQTNPYTNTTLFSAPPQGQPGAGGAGGGKTGGNGKGPGGGGAPGHGGGPPPGYGSGQGQGSGGAGIK